MEIVYFLISFVGTGFFMLLFAAIVVGILEYFGKYKYGDKYRFTNRDLFITYLIVAIVFLIFSYFNKGIIYVISILLSVALLFIFFNIKRNMQKNIAFLKQKTLLVKYYIFRRYSEPHPNSKIPDFVFGDYEIENKIENKIKSISVNLYNSSIINLIIVKGDLVNESRRTFDTNGKSIESFKFGIYNEFGNHFISKINEDGLLSEFHSYSVAKKQLEYVNYYYYDKSGNLTEEVSYDNNSKLRTKDVFIYSAKNELLEEINYDENLIIWNKLVNAYDEKGNKIKTIEVWRDENIKSTTYKYDINSNLIEEVHSELYNSYIRDYIYNEKGNVIEESLRVFKDESINEFKAIYDSNGNKIKNYDYYNNYYQNRIDCTIETFLYDSKSNIREITKLQNIISFNFEKNNIDEMISIGKGNVLYDLKGNIRTCIKANIPLSKSIHYFDEDGFEFECKRYDSNNIFLSSEKFDKPVKPELKEIYYDSIKTYNKNRKLIKEFGYTTVNQVIPKSAQSPNSNERLIEERIIEYYDE